MSSSKNPHLRARPDLDQWEEQRHAEAINDVREHPDGFVVLSVDEEGRARIRNNLDGTSFHDQENALRMLGTWAFEEVKRIHREFERVVDQGEES